MVLTWFEHVHRFVYAGTQCADIEEVLYSFQSGNVGMWVCYWEFCSEKNWLC